jgi:hypothetical protein
VDEADDIVVELPTLEVIALSWPVIEPILKRATDRTTGYEPIDILLMVMQGRMSMLVIRDGGQIVAVVITEVRQFPRSRVLEVPFIAGSGLYRWHRQLLDMVDTQARLAGCADVMGFMRPGWQRFGFEADGVILRRRVVGG